MHGGGQKEPSSSEGKKLALRKKRLNKQEEEKRSQKALSQKMWGEDKISHNTPPEKKQGKITKVKSKKSRHGKNVKRSTKAGEEKLSRKRSSEKEDSTKSLLELDGRGLNAGEKAYKKTGTCLTKMRLCKAKENNWRKTKFMDKKKYLKGGYSKGRARRLRCSGNLRKKIERTGICR